MASKKSGTPTMGGFVFNIAILITGLWVPLCFDHLTPVVLALDVTLILYGLIGFWDDSIKLFKNKTKVLLQGRNYCVKLSVL